MNQWVRDLTELGSKQEEGQLPQNINKVSMTQDEFFILILSLDWLSVQSVGTKSQSILSPLSLSWQAYQDRLEPIVLWFAYHLEDLSECNTQYHHEQAI